MGEPRLLTILGRHSCWSSFPSPPPIHRIQLQHSNTPLELQSTCRMGGCLSSRGGTVPWPAGGALGLRCSFWAWSSGWHKADHGPLWCIGQRRRRLETQSSCPWLPILSLSLEGVLKTHPVQAPWWPRSIAMIAHARQLETSVERIVTWRTAINTKIWSQGKLRLCGLYEQKKCVSFFGSASMGKSPNHAKPLSQLLWSVSKHETKEPSQGGATI